MKELIAYLVAALVDKPEAVHIEEKSSEKGLVYALHVSKEDLGKVIGKKGRTAKALRTYLELVGKSQKIFVSLEIVEPPSVSSHVQTAATL